MAETLWRATEERLNVYWCTLFLRTTRRNQSISSLSPKKEQNNKYLVPCFFYSSSLNAPLKTKAVFFSKYLHNQFFVCFFHSEDWAITSSVSSLSFSSEEISSSFSAPASETLYPSRTAAVKAREWKTSGLEKWWMWYLAYPKSHSLAVAVSLKDAACVGHLF